MIGLFRRISHSVIPRPDRPWEDDPTSNAPHKRKRRLSLTDRDSDPDMEQSSQKKIRGDSVGSSVTDVVQEGSPAPLPQTETQEVKEVTQGVKDVELAEAAAPESVPLPMEDPDELDELASTPTPPPEVQPGLEASESPAPLTNGVLDTSTGPEIPDNPLIPEADVPSEGDKKEIETVSGPTAQDGSIPIPTCTDDAGPRRKTRSKTKDGALTED